MKKRSLFAAVAMLIVSAIVLTSATYAWFVVGSDADITGISVEVAGADSGVQVRLYNSGNWSGSLSGSTLATDTTNNKIPATYVPATAYINNNVFTPLAGAFDAEGSMNITTSAATAGTDYALYKFSIRKTGDAGKVDVTPDISVSGGSTANDALKVAIAHCDGSTTTFLGIWGDDGYDAIKTAGTYLDSSDDKIISTADDSTYSSALQAVTLASGTVQTTSNIGTSGNDYILVYIWIEGNDSECLNAIASQQATVSINFAAA